MTFTLIISKFYVLKFDFKIALSKQFNLFFLKMLMFVLSMILKVQILVLKKKFVKIFSKNSKDIKINSDRKFNSID